MLALLLSLPAQTPNSTGRLILAMGSPVPIGGFPVNAELSPSGRWMAVTNTGIDQRLSIIDTTTGRVTGALKFNGLPPGKKSGKDGLYFGLAFVKQPDGKLMLWASHGGSDRVAAYRVSQTGQLEGPVETYSAPRPLIGALMPQFFAGVALSADQQDVFVLGNQTFALSEQKGAIVKFRRGNPKSVATMPISGFPLDIRYVAAAGSRPAKLFATSEREGHVLEIDPDTLAIRNVIRTGEQPTYLNLNRDGSRLFVTNSNSDTVSEIDTTSNKIVATYLSRPVALRGLPGTNPLGSSLSPDEKTLYVALSDLNCVAVFDRASRQMMGMVPTGWYPTDVVASKSGLHILSAKGDRFKNPNVPPAMMKKLGMENGDSGPGIRASLRGLAYTVKPSQMKTLAAMTQLTLQLNHVQTPPKLPPVPAGIKHVIYIVKENRTYDQMFGDLPQGLGMKELHLYGDDVIPNQRALAKRFVLFDNFYANAEMSADGWSWSTAGITSEYVQRNAQYEYSGRKREYDYEGQKNGTPADAYGLRNVNDPPGGYIWDNALRQNREFKNYGMYIALGVPLRDRAGRPISNDNEPTMRAFAGRVDPNFRMYDLDYADSDAWEKYGLTYPKHRKEFRGFKSRIAAWRADYARLIKAKKVPPLMLLRLGNNHTNGTTPGAPTPSAMIADNDYALGQLVETVSNGPLWNQTAIVCVEDDAQGGYDHVEGHRSIAFVIHPKVRRAKVDSRFFNTDSALRTVEWLLGMKPANQMMFTAKPLDVFEAKVVNGEPYKAILPAKATFRANTATAYRAADSARLFHTFREESAPDRELADILWGAEKGANSARPRLVSRRNQK